MKGMKSTTTGMSEMKESSFKEKLRKLRASNGKKKSVDQDKVLSKFGPNRSLAHQNIGQDP